MLKLNVLASLLLFTMLANAADQTINVEQYGRRIQVDGFLIEWNSQLAHTWNHQNQNWFFDAANTPEGLAGYIRSDSAVKCSSWIFTFISGDTSVVKMNFPSDGTDFYKYDRALFDSLQIMAFEWLIPWDKLSLDSSGSYSINLNALSACGDSLSALKIRGTVTEKKADIVSASFILRAILILVLLIIYVVLSIKISKRQKNKKGSVQSQ